MPTVDPGQQALAGRVQALADVEAEGVGGGVAAGDLHDVCVDCDLGDQVRHDGHRERQFHDEAGEWDLIGPQLCDRVLMSPGPVFDHVDARPGAGEERAR